MGPWFVLFFCVPIVEMYLLIEVGSHIGAALTVGLVMLTAVLGLALLRIQGLATLTRGLGRLQQGELPALEVAEGLMLAVAGALLITPGFLTDAIGFLLLIPAGRVRVAGNLARRFGPPEPFHTSDAARRSAPGHHPDVIEGEFVVREDRKDP